jgi:hypothetical protein
LGSANGADSPATLKSAFKDYFMIGVALNQRQFTGQDTNGVVDDANRSSPISMPTSSATS